MLQTIEVEIDAQGRVAGSLRGVEQGTAGWSRLADLADAAGQ
ncbi:hypothetical protein [Acidithiobacillus sp.]